MTPIEWDGDVKVAANGDAFGMNRAALTAMRYAAHHEKLTENGYDPIRAVVKIFAGMQHGIDELRQAAYETGQRESARFAYDDFDEKQKGERLIYRKLIDLIHEAERSICRHLRERYDV